MICPYCGKEMREGLLTGDGRSALRWSDNDEKLSIFDKLGGKGTVESAQYNWAAFKLDAVYCSDCKKLIIDTDIQS